MTERKTFTLFLIDLREKWKVSGGKRGDTRRDSGRDGLDSGARRMNQ